MIYRSRPFLGLAFGLIFTGGSFLSCLGQAQAADNFSVNVNMELAKKVVRDVNPIINEYVATPEVTPLASTPEGYLDKPLIAETKVTKEPQKVVAPKIVKTTVKKAANILDKTTLVQAGHTFPYGYCTYYVSQRRIIPWSGNAISWLVGAQKYGFATGSTPTAGSIIVTSEGGRTGHVGMVDAVNGDQITITEMNYRGFGVVSSRTISANYGAIMGYIY